MVNLVSFVLKGAAGLIRMDECGHKIYPVDENVFFFSILFSVLHLKVEEGVCSGMYVQKEQTLINGQKIIIIQSKTPKVYPLDRATKTITKDRRPVIHANR